MSLLIELLRVQQWVKNFVLIAPLIFSGEFDDLSLWGRVVLSFLGFSFITSFVYIFNDIADIKLDKFHPKKSLRPLIAGQISSFYAQNIACVLLVLGLGISYFLDLEILILNLGYVLLFILYNRYFKKIVFLDVLTVALGFEVRIWVGALSVGVMPSFWLQICMFVLALFLAFTKRRCEKILLEDKAASHRTALNSYSMSLLNQMINICAVACIILYGLYTNSFEVTQRIHSHAMMYSIIFVFYGIFRYLYLLDIKKIISDPTEIISSDKSIIINIILWLCFVMFVISKFTY